MSTGAQAVADFVRRVESLVALDRDVAVEAAEPVADVVRASIGKAETPTGEAWAERSDGGRALQGTQDKVHARANGRKVVLTLAPPLSFHNWGAGGSSTTAAADRSRKAKARRDEKSTKATGTATKSRFHAPRRQVLPDSGTVPEQMNAAIADAAKRVFERKAGG